MAAVLRRRRGADARRRGRPERPSAVLFGRRGEASPKAVPKIGCPRCPPAAPPRSPPRRRSWSGICRTRPSRPRRPHGRGAAALRPPLPRRPACLLSDRRASWARFGDEPRGRTTPSDRNITLPRHAHGALAPSVFRGVLKRPVAIPVFRDGECRVRPAPRRGSQANPTAVYSPRPDEHLAGRQFFVRRLELSVSSSSISFHTDGRSGLGDTRPASGKAPNDSRSTATHSARAGNAQTASVTSEPVRRQTRPFS